LPRVDSPGSDDHFEIRNNYFKDEDNHSEQNVSSSEDNFACLKLFKAFTEDPLHRQSQHMLLKRALKYIQLVYADNV